MLLIASSRYLSGALFLNGPLRVRVLSPSHAVGLSRGRSPRSGDHERAGPDACGHQRRARDWVTRSALRPRRDNLRRGRFCQGREYGEACEKPSGEGQQARLGDALPWAHAMELRSRKRHACVARANPAPGPITIGTIFQFRQRWSGRESFMAAPALQRSFGRSADFSQEAIKTREQKATTRRKKCWSAQHRRSPTRNARYCSVGSLGPDRGWPMRRLLVDRFHETDRIEQMQLRPTDLILLCSMSSFKRATARPLHELGERDVGAMIVQR